MKRISIILVCMLAIAAVQTGSAMQHENVQMELMKNIQGLWKAFQDHNPEPFKQWLSPEGMTVTAQGAGKISAVIEMVAAKQCQVNSYSIDEKGSQLSQIDANTYLIIYNAEQDATCDGAKLPASVTVSEIWTNKDGKWKGIFYQETDVSR